MNFLQLDVVLMLVALVLLVVLVVKSNKTITHYQRTDMVDMVLSAKEYMIFLKSGDIKGEWQPIFNGKLLPLDAGVLEASLAAQAELDAKAAWEDENWHVDEANAHYAAEDAAKAAAEAASTVVACVGRCECGVEHHFTTTLELAEDYHFATMIACNHCTVCNTEYDTTFHGGFEDGAGWNDWPESVVVAAPDVEVVTATTEGVKVHFTFTDGSTAMMRSVLADLIADLDCPFEGGYHVTFKQAEAIDRYTGFDCIPF